MNLTMVDRHCPVCGSADQSRVFAHSNVDLSRLDSFAFASRKFPEYMHWRLIECDQCDLLYSSPAPAEQSLGEAYEEAAFDSAVEARFAAQTYAAFLPRIAKLLPDRIGALDIGTGEGAFLAELLNAGFTEVIGVEPSTQPIAGATESIRPLIQHGLFREETFAPSSFSLITCFQTFEHLAEPLAMCRSAYALLKPGGAVLFVGHNRRALSAKLMGFRSPIFDIEHLQLFSPASVRRMMEEARFDRIEVGSIWNRYPLHYWTKLLPLPTGMKRTIIGLMNRCGWGKIPIAVPAGNLFAIGYKPR